MPDALSDRLAGLESRIKKWQQIQESYARAETASSKSRDGAVTIRLSISGTVDVRLDYERAELADDGSLAQSVIETYNSAGRRLDRGLRQLHT